MWNEDDNVDDSEVVDCQRLGCIRVVIPCVAQIIKWKKLRRLRRTRMFEHQGSRSTSGFVRVFYSHNGNKTLCLFHFVGSEP